MRQKPPIIIDLFSPNYLLHMGSFLSIYIRFPISWNTYPVCLACRILRARLSLLPSVIWETNITDTAIFKALVSAFLFRSFFQLESLIRVVLKLSDRQSSTLYRGLFASPQLSELLNKWLPLQDSSIIINGSIWRWRPTLLRQESAADRYFLLGDILHGRYTHVCN